MRVGWIEDRVPDRLAVLEPDWPRWLAMLARVRVVLVRGYMRERWNVRAERDDRLRSDVWRGVLVHGNLVR